jgi:hypothetical protein
VHSIRQLYRDFVNSQRGAAVYKRFKRILYSERDSLVAQVCTSILPRLPAVRRERVQLCDVGGGDGERIIAIVDHLHRRSRNACDVDFVEQSRVYTDDFARKTKPPFLRATIHFGLFEDVSLPPRAYDVVFLIHSIFAFANGAAIEKVLGLVRDDGSAVVVSNAPDSFLAGLKRLVDADFDDARYEIGDLSRSLDAYGVRYSIDTFETVWNIEHHRWGEDLAVILDWISLGRFASFDEGRSREIERYILDASVETSTGRSFSEKEVVLVLPPFAA